MKPIELPSQARLKELFRYDDGKLYWIKAKGNRPGGNRAGCISRSGKGVKFRKISIDKVRYAEHRVIAQFLGLDTDGKLIDHIDGNPLNNRIENLRSATNSENLRNTRKKSRTFGGVHFDKSRSKWMAFVGEEHGFKNLGRFDSLLDAIAARLRYNRENGYSDRHGR